MILTLVTTDWLSQNTSAGPSIGTPNIRILCLNPYIISVAIRNAMNSEPKIDDSTVLWRLMYHMIGELLTNITIPVWYSGLFNSGVLPPNATISHCFVANRASMRTDNIHRTWIFTRNTENIHGTWIFTRNADTQNTLDLSSFGSKFIALWIATKMI